VRECADEEGAALVRGSELVPGEHRACGEEQALVEEEASGMRMLLVLSLFTLSSWPYLHRLGRGSQLGSSLSRSDLGKIRPIISSQAEGWRRARELPRRQVAATRLTPATTQAPALVLA